MGADIHGWVEKRHNGKWVAVDHLPELSTQRNYGRFAKLASVRGDGPEPRGTPDDVSETVAFHISNWEPDGHSHSWLTIREALPIFNGTGQPCNWPLSNYFALKDEAPLDEFRIVFWFDN